MNNLLNIKSFLKFLSRNKAYTAIDVFGLSVSLMFVILIAVYTVQELSVDKFHKDVDRIYVLANDKGPSTALPIAYRLQERYPEIEQVCPVITTNVGNQIVKNNDKKLTARTVPVDSCFFNFFSFKLLAGDKNRVLENRSNVVLSKTFANKLFGTEDPIGQSVIIGDSLSFLVSGIMEDIKHSTIPYADIMFRVERAHEYNWSISMDHPGNAGSTVAFLKMKPGADLRPKIPDILAYFKESFWIYQRDMSKVVNLIPMSELYFSELNDFGSVQTGNKRLVIVLLSVGILILVFAIFNYINLTVAQAGQRAKEMATRRLLGSSRGDLFIRMMIESTLLTVISFGIGWLLAHAAVPFVNDLLQTQIDLMATFTPGWCLAGIVLILLIGVVAGLLPAVLISSVKPIDIVRGTFRRQTKMVFSKVFITFQNGITIAMIAASIVMILQSRHLINAPLGYNTNSILEVANGFANNSDRNAAIDEFGRQPFVKRVGLAAGMPLSGSNNMSSEYEGKFLGFQQFIMDSTAFNMLGYKIVRDNQLAEKSWYVTEKAMRDMELPQDAPSFLWNKNATPIAGIVQDFQLGNITNDMRPAMLRIDKRSEMFPWSILIEVEGNPYTAYNKIQEIYKEASGGLDFNATYLNEQVQKSFESEVRMTKIVSLFASIAVIISMLGLLAMSTYFIHQRSQEVAIRKVFGSDNQAILIRLIGSFLVYVGVAFIIATPIIWYFMNQWLSDYSYRISLNPLIFIVSGIFCLVIALVTVFFQSYKAANANPIESVSGR
ncbi:ABC transporter permease [Parabacteroides faecis]|uniref:ABC transport system permease protein n=1 Tax=Parabacteroides faecis TaxID=1217282 RepID=A0ABR6KNZ9_9BACT|nr:FtsX-like permease family protein [Parabacteroides faecis]MBB4623238.1 putative ABC transport system permease protein [Parabacteroides faecis]GGJ99254.1 ABC transporter permease [Parabacteroides faecis]